jgi:hypothetical protein
LGVRLVAGVNLWKKLSSQRLGWIACSQKNAKLKGVRVSQNENCQWYTYSTSIKTSKE